MADNFAAYRGPQKLAEALAEMHQVAQQNMNSMATLMARKDEHYRSIKAELADQMVERRKREEGSKFTFTQVETIFSPVAWSCLVPFFLISFLFFLVSMHPFRHVL